MKVRFSSIGQRIGASSGIEQLMDDLGHALATGGSGMRMLGGGNPAAIPEVTALWRAEMARLLEEEPDRFDRMLVNYDPCRGNPEFITAIVELFNRNYDWDITPDHVVVTNGGQTAFFFLVQPAGGSAHGRAATPRAVALDSRVHRLRQPRFELRVLSIGRAYD